MTAYLGVLAPRGIHYQHGVLIPLAVHHALQLLLGEGLHLTILPQISHILLRLFSRRFYYVARVQAALLPCGILYHSITPSWHPCLEGTMQRQLHYTALLQNESFYIDPQA